ncbi:MAG TPA: hypothetical protein VF406_16220 [Thermodesulfobacteriota bacterium]
MCDPRAVALHALIEEKAVEVYPRVEASGDPARDITGADRRAVEPALEGSGVPFNHFARVQRDPMKRPEALPRFFELEQQVKAERRQGDAGVGDASGTPGVGNPRRVKLAPAHPV